MNALILGDGGCQKPVALHFTHLYKPPRIFQRSAPFDDRALLHTRRADRLNGQRPDKHKKRRSQPLIRLEIMGKVSLNTSAQTSFLHIWIRAVLAVLKSVALPVNVCAPWLEGWRKRATCRTWTLRVFLDSFRMHSTA